MSGKSAPSLRLAWVSDDTSGQLRGLRLKPDEALIVLTPPAHLEAVGRALFGDPRVLMVQSDEVDLAGLTAGFALSGASLHVASRTPLKHAGQGYRADVQDSYCGFSAMRKAMGDAAAIDLCGPDWTVPLRHNRGIDHLFERYKGERILVLGNGPSLADVPGQILREHVTIGSNAVHMMFEAWGFPVTYWMCEDRLQIETELDRHAEALSLKGGAGPERLPVPLPVPLLPYEYAANIDWPEALLYPLLQSDGQVFPDGLSFPAFTPFGRAFRHGYTVTVSAIQLAVFMGAREIVLYGVDHNYALAEDREALWTGDDAAAPTHFDKTYTAGRSFIRPRPLRAEQAYQAARDWCDAHGVRIMNGSPKSALKVFEALE